ncbi:unnamed protein product [Pleuronectes platessa]|uniref:Uncharacterized protein n=1 Tax=Pleuronectes platessa TaxID=8262 RepID=A0A9N7TR92_PLEPL|nr:unnamed protein product [Pleuronectes platessa]
MTAGLTNSEPETDHNGAYESQLGNYPCALLLPVLHSSTERSHHYRAPCLVSPVPPLLPSPFLLSLVLPPSLVPMCVEKVSSSHRVCTAHVSILRLYARTGFPRESPPVGPSSFRFLPPSLIHDPGSVT